MRRTLVAIGALLALSGPTVMSTSAHAATSPPGPVLIGDRGTAPGWTTLSYGGERFEVPATWPVRDVVADPSLCVRFDRHAVYEGIGGSGSSCPSQLMGVTEAVQVQPLDALGRAQAGRALSTQTIGGQTALVGSDEQASQRLVAAFPAAGVLVTISYGGDQAIAERILSSFRASRAGASRAGASRAGAATSRAGSPAATPVTRGATPSTSAPTAATTTTGVSVGPVSWAGLAFDACTAPSPAAMAAWRQSSPYRGVGVYIGGINRACGDGYLSSSYVNAEVAAGWDFIPLYVGRQASCANQGGLQSISTSGAAGLQGVQAADDAVAQAELFGMNVGSPIYFDMESWNTSDRACSASVVTFVRAWDKELANRGFVSGIYGSADGGLAQDIAPLFARSGLPTDVDIAEWDGQANTNSYYLTANDWPNHHRIKQFEGGNTQSFGGMAINLDQDYVDGDVVGNQQPGVTAVSPLAATVGQSVTVLGRAFVAGRTQVSFGGIPATAVTVTSPGRLTARVPAQAITTVDVSVTTSGGTSLTSPADRFRYLPIIGTAADQATGGYWLTAPPGNVYPYNAPFHGSAAARHPSAPVVGIAADARTGGYWLVTATGTVYSYDAPFYGDTSGRTLAAPVTSIAADPVTGGYWLVTAKGNVFNFNAPFHGSTATRALTSPVTGIAADAATGGYRLVTAKGNIFNFDAPFHGSTATRALSTPVTGIAADAATGGYWIVTGGGTVYSFDAPYYGSLGPSLPGGAVSITADGAGYLLTTAAGNVQAFNTPGYGSPAG